MGNSISVSEELVLRAAASRFRDDARFKGGGLHRGSSLRFLARFFANFSVKSFRTVRGRKADNRYSSSSSFR
jgi:hypothetical protein